MTSSRAAAALPVAGLLIGMVSAALLGGAHGAEVAARAAASLAGALTLGLAALPALGRERTLTDRSVPFLATSAATWAVFGAVELVLSAAARAGVAPWRVDGAALAAVTAGASGATLGTVIALVLAAAVAGYAAAGRVPATSLTVPVAAFGLITGPSTGHLSLSPLGSIAVSVHVLAACWWVGSLAAMALLLRGRRQWARVLPAFSRWAVWVVAALSATGVLALLLHTTDLGSPYALVAWAKVVVLAAAVALAARHRRRWVPNAERHRVSEARSLRNAALEAALLSVAFGLAAALSLTA